MSTAAARHVETPSTDDLTTHGSWPNRRVSAWLLLAISVVATAGIADVLVHIVHAPAAWETGAHLATLVGMVATVAGVIHRGLQYRSRDKEMPNAIR